MPDYDKFRTGLTYRDVLSMLYSADPDPKTWRYKTRGVVLGLWHQLKQEMWDELMRREHERKRHAQPRRAAW